MVVAIIALRLRGYGANRSVFGGAWLGMTPLWLVIGFVNALLPERVLRWRAGAMAGGSHAAPIGQWFTRLTAATGPRPWESSLALTRVRILGISQLLVWSIAGVLILGLVR
jgi:hypothetical protein